MKTQNVLAVFLVGAQLFAAHAEFRIWTDGSGRTMEAEFVRMFGDKALLRLRDGSEIQISPSTLSPKDQKTLLALAPPRIDIAVSTITDRENKGRGGGYFDPNGIQIKREAVQCKVVLQKGSLPPYDGKLTAQIYLFGKPGKLDNYVVLDRTDAPFHFAAKNGNEFQFSSANVNLKQLQAGGQYDSGLGYEGYLVLVMDSSGSIIAKKANKSSFAEHASRILGAKRGTVFDAGFKEVKAKRADELKSHWRPHVPGRRF